MARSPHEPSRILVVQTAFLGDAVLATPLFPALKTLFPSAKLAFMGTPAGVELLSGHPLLDELIPYDKRGAEKGIKGLKSKARQLSARGFDAAVSAHRSARTALLLKLAGIPFRVGFKSSAFPWLYTVRVPRHPRLHEVLRNLALLEPFGSLPEDFKPRTSLPSPPPSSLIENHRPRPWIAVAAGSVWPTKRWPPERFAAAARELAELTRGSIFLIGSPQDQETAAQVEAKLGNGKVVNLVGKTSLKEWVSVISAMDLVITNDSSPAHIAAALSVPVVSIFGPTTPDQGFAPWTEKKRVVEVPLACRPCGEHGGPRCPEGHFYCMNLVEPAKVVEASLELLEESKQ